MELTRLSLYWHGPKLIYDKPSDWAHRYPTIPLRDLPEVQPVSLATQAETAPVEWFSRFSSYTLMIRVVAYLHRFLDNCRRPDSAARTSGFLRYDEIARVTKTLIIESQRIHFAVLLRELSRGRTVSSKPLARLPSFIDPEGVIRVGGRLRHSLLSYDCKHPILLGKRAHFTMVLCRSWHKTTYHAGPRVLITLISRQY